MPGTRFSIGLLAVFVSWGISLPSANAQGFYNAYALRYQRDIDKSITPDYTPIIVLPPIELRAFHNVQRVLRQPYNGAFSEVALTT
jgi:hypothetical protein